MSELGPNEERWLDALRGADEPTAADKSRVRAAVLASIGVGVGAAAAAGAAGAAAAGVGASASASASASAGVGVGAAAGAGAAAGTAAGAGAGAAAGAGTAATVGATAAKATAAATVAKSGGLFGSIAAWKIGLAVVSLVAVSGATTAVVHHQRQAATSITPSRGLATTGAANDTSNARIAPPPSAAFGAVGTSEASSPSTAPSETVSDNVASPAVPAAPEPSAAPVVAAGPVVAPKVRPDHHAPGAAKGAAAHSSELEAEVALLNQAQQARAHGDLDGALRALGKHAKEHPRGMLAVERDSLRVLVACEAKRPEARALATKFVTQNPSSPFVSRVKKACLLDP